MVGLDPRSARILKDLFRVFVERGGTVFLSSHTLEVVEAVCDRIAIIREGAIIAQGTMDDLRGQVDSGGGDLPQGHWKRGHGRGRGRLAGVTLLSAVRGSV